MPSQHTTLAALIDLLQGEGLLVSVTNPPTDAAAVGVCGCDCDSRVAAAGHVFVCKGRAFRPAFLTSALGAGCVAYLCNEELADQLAQTAPDACGLVVNDIRRAMGIASPEAWGHPDRDLTVIGITGTKGKTTVAYMLHSILDGSGVGDTDEKGASGQPAHRAGIMGSIDIFDGIEHFESVNTTPEAPDLWRHLANARDAGLAYMVMEVASQGLKYDRVLGLDIDVALFLNIGRDHLSPVEHPDFEDYFASKLEIFDQAHMAVVCADSDHADRILAHAAVCERVLTFSLADSSADLWASDVRIDPGHTAFVAHTPTRTLDVDLGMGGLFNVTNALAALATCEVLGTGADACAAGLSRARVPGRMELLGNASSLVVGLVDYAHNKLSYQAFGASLAQEFPGRAVITVLGAPGDKAYERRTELPQEAAKWSDLLIYTEEDPAHERVEDICGQMAEATPGGQAFEVIPDRTEAIFRAVEAALSVNGPSVVCLLAKGDETRQHEGDEFVPMEPDGSVFMRALNELAGDTGSAGEKGRPVSPDQGNEGA